MSEKPEQEITCEEFIVAIIKKLRTTRIGKDEKEYSRGVDLSTIFKIINNSDYFSSDQYRKGFLALIEQNSVLMRSTHARSYVWDEKNGGREPAKYYGSTYTLRTQDIPSGYEFNSKELCTSKDDSDNLIVSSIKSVYENRLDYTEYPRISIFYNDDSLPRTLESAAKKLGLTKSSVADEIMAELKAEKTKR